MKAVRLVKSDVMMVVMLVLMKVEPMEYLKAEMMVV